MVCSGLMVISFLAPSSDGSILKQLGSAIAIKARQEMSNKGGSMYTTSTNTTPPRLRREHGRIPLVQEAAARARAAAERQAEVEDTAARARAAAERQAEGSESSWWSALVTQASSWLGWNSAGENQIDWGVVTKELKKEDFMTNADEESMEAGAELIRMAFDTDVRTLIQHIFDNREILVETLREGRKTPSLYSLLENNSPILCKIMEKYSNPREFRTLLELTWKIHNPEEIAKNWITETVDITLINCFFLQCAISDFSRVYKRK